MVLEEIAMICNWITFGLYIVSATNLIIGNGLHKKKFIRTGFVFLGMASLLHLIDILS